MKKTIVTLSLAIASFTVASTKYGIAHTPLEAAIKSTDQQAYAYAPATVFYEGEFHQFYCSSGGWSDPFYKQPNMDAFTTSADHIRYRTSKNGIDWSAPRILITQSNIKQKNYKEQCACDPAIINGGDGYWYMYYAGALPDWGTVVYLARSKSIAGPYEKYIGNDGSGTAKWEHNTNYPVPVLYRTSTITQALSAAGKSWKQNELDILFNPYAYGVGQVSVIKKGSTFSFWFTDGQNEMVDYNSLTTSGTITNINDIKSSTKKAAPITRFYYMSKNCSSKDGEGTYGTCLASIQNQSRKLIKLKNGSTSKNWFESLDFGDVKYNDTKSRLELWIPSPFNPDIKTRPIAKFYSTDGYNWTKTSFTEPTIYFKHNVGVSGDEYGHITNNQYFVYFGAPFDQEKFRKTFIDKQSSKDPMISSVSSIWYIGMSDNGFKETKVSIPWGETFEFGNLSKTNLKFITGDYDGDGVTDLAAVDTKNHKWYIRSSYNQSKGINRTGVRPISWEWTWKSAPSSYEIVPGDYDGDGITDRAIYSSSNSNYHIYPSRSESNVKCSVESGAKFAVPGDYDGDGVTDIAVIIKNSETKYTWHKYLSSTRDNFNNVCNGVDQKESMESSTFKDSYNLKPVVADFDGDGITDLALYGISSNNNNGYWWIKSSRTGNYYTNPNGETMEKWTFAGQTSSHTVLTGDYTGDGAANIGIADTKKGNWYILNGRTADLSSIYKYATPHEYKFGATSYSLKNYSNVAILTGDYDGDHINDLAFVNLKTNAFYIYASSQAPNYVEKIDYKNSSGSIVNQDGSKMNGVNRYVYTIKSDNGYGSLAKSAFADNNIDEESQHLPTLKSNHSIKTDGLNMTIEGVNEGTNISLINIQGQILLQKKSEGGNFNIAAPSNGHFIVRIGKENHLVTIK